MAIKTLTELKELFKDGKYPIGQDFIDWLDSFYHLTDSVPPTSLGGLKRKVIDIGDWNMDTTSSVNIAHGLVTDKIRNVSGGIRDDSNTSFLPFYYVLVGGSPPEMKIVLTSTNVIISRLTGGALDNANFDLTPFNRGYIVIDYVD